jgi:hypothetical protein
MGEMSGKFQRIGLKAKKKGGDMEEVEKRSKKRNKERSKESSKKEIERGRNGREETYDTSYHNLPHNKQTSAEAR